MAVRKLSAVYVGGMSKSVFHLDLHSIAKNGDKIQDSLDDLFKQALSKRLRQAEIIPGKGSGQLMKQVKKYLEQPEIKKQYKRYQVDVKNHGRLFIYFR